MNKFCYTHLAIAGLVCLLSTPASADDWLTISGYSYHLTRRNEYRADNPGLGWERHTPDQNVTYAAGYYRNSYDRDTFYLGGRWEPLELGPARFGVFLALASGYWTPVVALPMVSIEHGPVGINLVAAPTIGKYAGYVGAQLKFKLR